MQFNRFVFDCYLTTVEGQSLPHKFTGFAQIQMSWRYFCMGLPNRSRIGLIKSDSGLSQSANAYMVIAFDGHTGQLKNSDKNAMMIFVNEQTIIGDVMLAYSVSPYSAITGIGTAISEGFWDVCS